MMMMIRVMTPTDEPAMLQHLAEARADWYCESFVALAALHAANIAAIPQNQPCKQKMFTRPQIVWHWAPPGFTNGAAAGAPIWITVVCCICIGICCCGMPICWGGYPVLASACGAYPGGACGSGTGAPATIST